MNKKLASIDKIESLLSQKIKNIYQERLKHDLSCINYKLFDRTLVITLEGIVTYPEKLLKENNHACLAKEVRKAVDSVIHPQIKEIIEEVLEVKVIDFLSDTTIDRDLTGAIAIFEFKSQQLIE